MSENQQNGSLAQSNGAIKTSLTTTSTVSSSSARPMSNNSSFLYSTNSMLSRDKVTRQVGAPPPTLPKYTSSFNAGTNGNLDKINRDRETGGSYRLPSLERLAMRQRIMDTDKPNGDTTSVRITMRRFSQPKQIFF